MLRAATTLLLLTVVSACGDPAQQLVGAWQTEDGNYRNHLELRADGTFDGALERMLFSNTPTPLGGYSGNWRVEHSRMTIVVTNSAVAMMEPGYSFTQLISDYSGDTFTLRSDKGHEETWRRVE